MEIVRRNKDGVHKKKEEVPEVEVGTWGKKIKNFWKGELKKAKGEEKR